MITFLVLKGNHVKYQEQEGITLKRKNQRNPTTPTLDTLATIDETNKDNDYIEVLSILDEE